MQSRRSESISKELLIHQLVNLVQDGRGQDSLLLRKLSADRGISRLADDPSTILGSSVSHSSFNNDAKEEISNAFSFTQKDGKIIEEGYVTKLIREYIEDRVNSEMVATYQKGKERINNLLDKFVEVIGEECRSGRVVTSEFVANVIPAQLENIVNLERLSDFASACQMLRENYTGKDTLKKDWLDGIKERTRDIERSIREHTCHDPVGVYQKLRNDILCFYNTHSENANIAPFLQQVLGLKQTVFVVDKDVIVDWVEGVFGGSNGAGAAGQRLFLPREAQIPTPLRTSVSPAEQGSSPRLNF